MIASCQCGALTADIADGSVPMTIACHCSCCQKRSGSPFGVIAYFPKDNVAISGEVREYSRATDTGSRFTTGFCPSCGSTLYGRTARLPSIIGITVGCIADPGFAAPAMSVYEQSRHGWIAMPEEMLHFQRGTGDA